MGTQFILGEVLPQKHAPRVAELVAQFDRAAPDSGVFTRSFDGPVLVGFHVGWSADKKVASPIDRYDVLPRWTSLRTFFKENGLDPGLGRDMTFECEEADRIRPNPPGGAP